MKHEERSWSVKKAVVLLTLLVDKDPSNCLGIETFASTSSEGLLECTSIRREREPVSPA